MTLMRNDCSRRTTDSSCSKKRKWVSSFLCCDEALLDKSDQDSLKLINDWNARSLRLVSSRLTLSRHVYDSRNTRICRSTLTAIFQRDARRAIRAKRVIALSAKPPVSGAAFTFSRALTDEEEALPCRCSARPSSTGLTDGVACKFFICLFVILIVKLLNTRFHQLSMGQMQSVTFVTSLNCNLFC